MKRRMSSAPRSLSGSSPVSSKAVAEIVSAAADLALFLDPRGIVVDVAGTVASTTPAWKKLVGRAWRETVTGESVAKVERLLQELRTGKPAKPREINQLADGVGEVPFRFSGVVVEANDTPSAVVVGRDLSAMAQLQQRLVTSQQALDTEYERLRQSETHYRVFFHAAAEGVLVVDTSSGRVVEANQAAADILEETPARLKGATLLELFDAKTKTEVSTLLRSLANGARGGEVRGAIASGRAMSIGATLFRQRGSEVALVRLWPASNVSPATTARASRMIAMLEQIPDAFVVTEPNGSIVAANDAFCELVNMANEKLVVGEPLDRWLGRQGVDLPIIVANLREQGTVKNFSTVVRSDFGATQEAIVTAVAALDGKLPSLAFSIRTVSSRAPSVAATPRSLDQLRELVGRVPLKDLVRESADLVEKLCIEVALDVSGNNRASAAQLLGLSRQGLYSKLRRYGFDDSDN